MKKRAIILVPGFSRREQFAARDQLVKALTHYTDGYHTTVADGAADHAADAINIAVTSRTSHYTADIDVYEAFWGDLIPDWSKESPWQRFKRGLILILYWATGGLFKAIFMRWEVPSRTIVGLMGFALLMLLWYLTVINVLALAILGDDNVLPEPVRQMLTWLPFDQQIIAFFAEIKDWSVYIFLIGILGLGRLEGAANISAFLRAYLRDDPMGEDDVGIRAKARHRVLDTLDHVYGSTKGYDEVHVVAHSLGGAIAVDALAECGKDLSRTTLHTWGALLGLLSQQEELIEMEIEKVYSSEVKISNWIDVVFTADWLGSPRPTPRVYVNGKPTKEKHPDLFPNTFSPPMPKTRWDGHRVHAAYYRCETVMLALIRPEEELPQPAAATG